jgi:hypothetical protein
LHKKIEHKFQKNEYFLGGKFVMMTEMNFRKIEKYTFFSQEENFRKIAPNYICVVENYEDPSLL